MRLLITGGAGFIGSNLAWALVGEHEILVVDDLSTGSSANLHPEVDFAHLDILDERIMKEFERFGPEVVVHLAAQSSVPVSLRDPELDWRTNVEGTRAVAIAAREAGARLVLSASSAAVYGDPVELPLAETARKSPESPYGHSKLAAEEVLAAELTSGDVDFASFRFANVYGPRQDAQGEGGVVAIFASSMVDGKAPVLFGSGEQTRDFIYVGDVISAVAAAISTEHRLCEGRGRGPAYNISTGSSVSVLELVELLRAASGYAGPVQHAPARAGDVPHSVLDPAKALEVFGWDARVPLDAGIAATYGWFAESSDA